MLLYWFHSHHFDLRAQVSVSAITHSSIGASCPSEALNSGFDLHAPLAALGASPSSACYRPPFELHTQISVSAIVHCV